MRARPNLDERSAPNVAPLRPSGDAVPNKFIADFCNDLVVHPCERISCAPDQSPKEGLPQASHPRNDFSSEAKGTGEAIDGLIRGRPEAAPSLAVQSQRFSFESLLSPSLHRT